MPRVTSGLAKNRKLKVPDIPNIRVAQDVFKQAVFAIIAEKINKAKCLDLYAGSGSFGIEALSRGAKSCDFVEEHKKATKVIEQNLKTCGLSLGAEVINQNATKFVADTINKYDIIFVDPFYDDLKHRFLMQNLEEILEENGLIAFSHGKELNIQSQIEGTKLKIITERRFGNSHLTILTH